MKIEDGGQQAPRTVEKPPLTVQNDVQEKAPAKDAQEDAVKEASGIANARTGDKLTLALNHSEQPKKQANDTAQSQISKGYVDVRV